MKTTPWFPAHIKPVHVGVYEARHNGYARDYGPYYAYWDGWQWGPVRENPALAFNRRYWPAPIQWLEWRGLADKPKE